MCANNDMAKKIQGGQTATQVYDAAYGTYKPLAPQLTGGTGTVKGDPKPFKGGK